MTIPRCEDLVVRQLGEPCIPSPLGGVFIPRDARVAAPTSPDEILKCLESGPIPAFVASGRRASLIMSPPETTIGVVTCGGLCPGLNDVIRAVTRVALRRYGVRRVLGFRYGFAGIPIANGHEPLDLTLERVATVHREAGSILGVSRGKQDIEALVDGLVEYGISTLIAIGGDGTLRAVHAICQEIEKRGLVIPVIAVPKTIDNDISWVQRSFGLDTAVAVARDALDVASNEARAAWDGVGLVRLMGRESGFITAMATLASGVVDFCLIPEVPFAIEGKGGLLDAIERRLRERRACVIAVAEGAGHDLLGTASIDASGNPVPHDIGTHLRDTIVTELRGRGIPVNIKYIDPSYMVRGTRATASDSVFCTTLGQQAVHAALGGYTDCVIGHWSQHFTLVPTQLATATRQRVNPDSSLWRSVLAVTGQSLAAPTG